MALAEYTKGPVLRWKDFFCYIWQVDVAKCSKVPGAPRNVNQARVITWLVGVTNYCTTFH